MRSTGYGTMISRWFAKYLQKLSVKKKGSSVIHFQPKGSDDDAAGRFLDPAYQTGSMGLITSCALPAGDAFALD